MRFLIVFLSFCFLSSCHSRLSDFEVKRYEIAYQYLTKDVNKAQPYLQEFSSDASGVKIIPRIFNIKDYQIYGKEYFTLKNSFKDKHIEKLSSKFSNINWRKDSDFRVLKSYEIKDFHGPLKYLYFSEIRNDSLRVDILGNPFTKYNNTTREKFLVVFKNDSIITVQKSSGYYD